MAAMSSNPQSIHRVRLCRCKRKEKKKKREREREEEEEEETLVKRRRTIDGFDFMGEGGRWGERERDFRLNQLI